MPSAETLLICVFATKCDWKPNDTLGSKVITFSSCNEDLICNISGKHSLGSLIRLLGTGS